ncbi:hypothetical protein HK102_012598 [Quaeritorhiza haematococci]|nr:hypothetical protein HK102_012598 [Quaeritorhiza haematococci]
MTTPKSSTPFKTADLTTPETTNASAGQTIDKRPVSPQPLRLPDELIWHIIESCPPHQIWSLRAVCKLFKRISESVFQEAVVGAGVGFGTYIGMANHDSKGKGKSQRATFKCPKPVISVNVTGCPYACSAPPLNYVMACRAVTKASTGSENSRMAVFDEDAAVENAWWEFRQAQSQNQNTGALSRNEQADAPMDLIEETMEVFGALKNREVADEEVEEADDTLEVETGEAQIQPSASDSDSGTAGNSNSISTSSSSSSSTSEHKPLSGTTVPITKGEARTFFKARTAWGMRKNLLSMQQQHDAVLRQLQHVRETRKSVQELGNILNITRIFALQERLVDSMAQNGRTHFKIALHWQLAMAMANACKSLTVVCGGGTCCDKRVRGELVLRLTKPHAVAGSPSLLSRLTLAQVLDSHTGCVNTLNWSSDGSLLASGSDDTCISIWQYQPGPQPSSLSPSTPRLFSNPSITKDGNGCTRLLIRFPTGHTANIFSTKFIPGTANSVIATCAGDSEVRVFDVHHSAATSVRASPRNVFKCHRDRVKRLATVEHEPSVLLSCSEDGTVRQHDLRLPHTCAPYRRTSCPRPLVNYSRQFGELTTISVNRSQPHYFAIGGSDPNIFLHDRRMLPQIVNTFRPESITSNSGSSGLFRDRSGAHVTAVKFAESNGRELLGSWGGQHVYLFDVNLSSSSSACVTFSPRRHSVSSSSGRVVQDSSSLRAKPGRTHGRSSRKSGSRRILNDEAPHSPAEIFSPMQFNKVSNWEEALHTLNERLIRLNAEAVLARGQEEHGSLLSSMPAEMDFDQHHHVTSDSEGAGTHSGGVSGSTRLGNRGVAYCDRARCYIALALQTLPSSDPSTSCDQPSSDQTSSAPPAPSGPRKRKRNEHGDEEDKNITASSESGKTQRPCGEPAQSLRVDLTSVTRVSTNREEMHKYLEKALRDSTRATALAPFHPWSWILRAVCRWGLGLISRRHPSHDGPSPSTSLLGSTSSSSTTATEAREITSSVSQHLADAEESLQSVVWPLTPQVATAFEEVMQGVAGTMSFVSSSRSPSGPDGVSSSNSSNTVADGWEGWTRWCGFWVAAAGVEKSCGVRSDESESGLAREEVGGTKQVEGGVAVSVSADAEQDAVANRMMDSDGAVDTDATGGQHAFGKVHGGDDENERWVQVRPSSLLSSQEVDEKSDDEFNGRMDCDDHSIDSESDYENDESNEEEEMDTDEEDEEEQDDVDSRFVEFPEASPPNLVRDTKGVFKGHCNKQTTKDVTFLGPRDAYVCSGSDDGNIFIWCKRTSKLVQILKADEHVVNVVAQHPHAPVIAASGIDTTVKVFEPVYPEGWWYETGRRGRDWNGKKDEWGDGISSNT